MKWDEKIQLIEFLLDLEAIYLDIFAHFTGQWGGGDHLMKIAPDDCNEKLKRLKYMLNKQLCFWIVLVGWCKYCFLNSEGPIFDAF